MAAPDSIVHGSRVVLRPATGADVAVVLGILTAPGVVEWWPGETEQSVREQLTSAEEHPFVVELDDEPVGFIQYTEELEPDYRHAGIDVALHPDCHGQGLGTDAVGALALHLVTERRHHRLTIDPAATNARAIRCYEKVGFRPVGILRQYERGADGTFHDGLLMDLLPDDLSADDGAD